MGSKLCQMPMRTNCRNVNPQEGTPPKYKAECTMLVFGSQFLYMKYLASLLDPKMQYFLYIVNFTRTVLNEPPYIQPIWIQLGILT